MLGQFLNRLETPEMLCWLLSSSGAMDGVFLGEFLLNIGLELGQMRLAVHFLVGSTQCNSHRHLALVIQLQHVVDCMQVLETKQSNLTG